MPPLRLVASGARRLLAAGALRTSKLLAARPLLALALAGALWLVWHGRREVQERRRLNEVLSSQIAQERGLAAAREVRLHDLAAENAGLADQLQQAGSGRIIETHAVASKREEITKGEVVELLAPGQQSPRGYSWRDPEWRFTFTDPDRDKHGDEVLLVDQRFDILATTATLPDGSTATALHLHELSPRTGKKLYDLPFDFQDARSFDAGPRGAAPAARSSRAWYVGAGLILDEGGASQVLYGGRAWGPLYGGVSLLRLPDGTLEPSLQAGLYLRF